MSSTQALYDSASLALAAYATLTSGPTNDEQRQAALKAAGMSAKQAEEFARRYPTVVTQFDDTATSFSATVFADVGGNLTLAIRGTLEPGDFAPTDANILGYGTGYDQIVAMVNWWQRATAPSGQVAQYALVEYPNAQAAVPPADAVRLYQTELAFGGRNGLQLLVVPSHRWALGVLRVWDLKNRGTSRGHRRVHLGRQNTAHDPLQDLWLRHAQGAAGAHADEPRAPRANMTRCTYP